MAESSAQLHVPIERLSAAKLDKHYATVSLIEELEAVDWYDQRAADISDPRLREILRHNRDEEMEHAAMLLGWLRSQDANFDRYLETYASKSNDAPEPESNHEEMPAKTAGHSLGIGSLKKTSWETS